MAESRGTAPETRLALFGKAQLGRDIYRAIREQINDCRARGIEPKHIWAGKDTIDAIHALWTAVAAKYDLKIPPGVAGVPMSQGMGMGRSQFVFEYHDRGTAMVRDASELKTPGSVLVRPSIDDPLPFNS